MSWRSVREPQEGSRTLPSTVGLVRQKLTRATRAIRARMASVKARFDRCEIRTIGKCRGFGVRADGQQAAQAQAQAQVQVQAILIPAYQLTHVLAARAEAAVADLLVDERPERIRA